LEGNQISRTNVRLKVFIFEESWRDLSALILSFEGKNIGNGIDLFEGDFNFEKTHIVYKE